MKRILTVVFITSVFLGLSLSSVQAQDADWSLYKEADGVEIYQKSTNCHDPSEGYHRRHVLLKFVNTTDQDVRVSWFTELWYNGECNTCHEPENPEYYFSVELQAGETKEGRCDLAQGKTLKIFETTINEDGERPQQDIAKLTDFSLNNIQVSPL
ncbi:MAG: hypothetical protein R6U19_06480 [Bacteroidales bacterium]